MWRLRRWYWRHARRYHGECCQSCGGPVRVWWHVDDELWDQAMHGAQGLRCVACFDEQSSSPLVWIAFPGWMGDGSGGIQGGPEPEYAASPRPVSTTPLPLDRVRDERAELGLDPDCSPRFDGWR